MATKKVLKPKYVIVRCRNAGVHAGEYVSHSGQEVVLRNSRRIWYWSGANSLSELAMLGAQNVANCKFSVPVDEIILTEACEIIACSNVGEAMIRECPVWKTK